jgi:hypothetical protein
MERGARPHALTPEVFSDRVALIEAIDAVLVTAGAVTRVGRCVLRLQQRLRAVIPDEAIDRFLALSEATNEREVEALIIVAGWAFDEGRRS